VRKWGVMPELPEVEHVRRTLEAGLSGARVVEATVYRTDYVVAEGSAQPSPEALLAGATLVRFLRRGKQLAILGSSGRVLCIHLGMSGHPAVPPRGTSDLKPTPAHIAKKEHLHVEWLFDAGRAFELRDPRRFGGVWCFESLDALQRNRWDGLGLDALDTPVLELIAYLKPTLHDSSRPIKSALLDQALLAGVGNIYADEALFTAGIRPSRRSSRLKTPELERLAAAVQAILAQAVAAGGSTIRDFADPLGSTGSYQQNHQVYGRAGSPCPRCGTKLTGTTIAQRTTVYCRTCQA
jgi:formamidopyrimidine-DNA glycosylase